MSAPGCDHIVRVDKLMDALRQLRPEWTVEPNHVGNLKVCDAAGEYVGWIHMMPSQYLSGGVPVHLLAERQEGEP